MQIKKLIVGVIETNCYILSNTTTNNCIIIDPGGEFEIIDNFLIQNKLIPKYIINTHGHSDHILANNELKDKYNCAILIHKNDAEMLENSNLNLSFFSNINFTSYKADKLLTENDIIECNGIKLKVIHTPGHTPGGICLLTNNYLFSGDTLFHNSIGRTDLPAGSSSDLLKNIKEKLFILDDSIQVFPGHGEKTSIKNEKQHNPFF